MKKFIPFFCLITITITVFFYNSFFKKNEPRQTISKWEKKHIPSDYFYFQRSYPDTKFPVKAFENGLKATQKDFLKKKNEKIDEPWQVEGPGNIGGRITTIAVHPQNPETVWVGCSRGGVFKTDNNGIDWTPVFDDQPFLSIGDIEFDPNNPQTIYVGTGDKDISGLPGIGDGVYKTEDGGQTWTNIGLTDERIVSEVKVHPNNSNLIYASTMGIPFERNEQRGLYKSIDGGQTWEKILYLGDQTGVIDILIHPENENIVYAAGWDRIRNNTESMTYGVGGKVYKTTDGGDNWDELNNGFPTDSLSRIGLAMDASNSERIFSLLVGKNHDIHSILKSENGGGVWENISLNDGVDGALNGFGWFFGQIRVNPFNPDEVFVLGVDMWKTTDNGETWNLATPEWWTYEVHADKHDLVFIDENTMILGTDGGVYKTEDGGITWVDYEDLPNTQFYRVATNPHQKDEYWGGAQDNGTTAGNIDDFDNWPRIFGGDGFQMRFHPTDPNTVYVETQYGGMNVSTNGGNSFSNATGGIDGDDRVNWDAPYFISRHNPDILYTATHRVYKSTSGVIPFYEPISEDLTDGVVFKPFLHTISTIAEDKIDPNLLYAGTTDANVWRSVNGGTSWENITGNLPERYVTHVYTSEIEANTVFVTHSGYKDNDFIPHIHKSTDAGSTWEDISGDLPQIAINDMVTYHKNENFIFVATDGGVYFTENGGEKWDRLGNNMPVVPVYDVEIDTANHRLVAGTFARSIMTIDLCSIIEVENDLVVELIDDFLEFDAIEETAFVSNEELLENDIITGESIAFITDELLEDLTINEDGIFINDTNSFVDETVSISYFSCLDEKCSVSCDTATFSFTVINVDTKIDDILTKKINIYPNPTTSTFNLNLDPELKFPLQVQVFDVGGRLVDNLMLKTPISSVQMSTNEWGKGMFLVKVVDANGEFGVKKVRVE